MNENDENPTKQRRKTVDIPPPPPPPPGACFAYSHTVEDWSGRTAVLYVEEAVARNPEWRQQRLEGLDAWVLLSSAAWMEQHEIVRYLLTTKEEDDSLWGPMIFCMLTRNHRLFKQAPFAFVPICGGGLPGTDRTK